VLAQGDEKQSVVQNAASNVLCLSPLNQAFYRDEHLFVSLLQQVVMVDGEVVTLRRKKCRLLALLVQAGEVVSRAALLPHLCGYTLQTRTRTLDIHIRRLRQN
jgi:DNA-binding response OmpR family regulator